MTIRKRPNLLTPEEEKALLSQAENTWSELQANDLGGFSDGNRPFWIVHQFKHVIETFGRRDVGLTWSKNDLDALSELQEAASMRIFENPNHPYYGPVRRLWVILVQLDLLKAAGTIMTKRGDLWDDHLVRLMKIGLSESYAQRILLTMIIDEDT